MNVLNEEIVELNDESHPRMYVHVDSAIDGYILYIYQIEGFVANSTVMNIISSIDQEQTKTTDSVEVSNTLFLWFHRRIIQQTNPLSNQRHPAMSMLMNQ